MKIDQQWIRTFIPSWRLFEKTGEIARLYYRKGSHSERLGDWIRREPIIDTSHFCKRLFFNPTATKEHAIQNRLYHFLYDLENRTENIEEIKSYQFIQRILEEDLKPATWYQFQIRSYDQNSNKEEVLVTSAIHLVALNSKGFI